MRKALMLAVLLAACSKAETPAADTTAMAPAAAAAPAPLTAADVAGKWSGTSMAETTDSVTLRWTTENVDDMHGTLIIEGRRTPSPSRARSTATA